jgi:hypothetical protein
LSKNIAHGGKSPLQESTPVAALCQSPEIVKAVRYEEHNGWTVGLDERGEACIVGDMQAPADLRSLIVRHRSGAWLSVAPFGGVEAFFKSHRLPRPPRDRYPPERPVASTPLKPRML